MLGSYLHRTGVMASSSSSLPWVLGRKWLLRRKACTTARPKVVVGMSGGVDSSVAALLLKQQGYDVTGLYMKNWETSDEVGQETCPYAQDYKDVEQVCKQIGIPCKKVDFVQTYWNNVFSPCLNRYQEGATPNPDILCNREIKFNVFLDHALSMGANYVATGHYARLRHLPEGQTPQLLAGKDVEKDQSYFLCAVPGEAFRHVLFPLGDMTKPQVREIARDFGLSTALKKDSVGICFIGKRKFSDFILDYVPEKKGCFVSVDGEIMGEHTGLSTFTIGQGAKLQGMSDKWYVVGKRPDDFAIIVAPGSRHPALFYDTLFVRSAEFSWINPNDAKKIEGGESVDCLYRVRYRQPLDRCRVSLVSGNESSLQFSANHGATSLPNGKLLQLNFAQPQKAIALQQTLCLYTEQQVCLGGGPIIACGPSYHEQGRSVPTHTANWSMS